LLTYAHFSLFTLSLHDALPIYSNNLPFFFVLGSRNNEVAPSILINVSDSRLAINSGRKPFNSHKLPITINTVPTHFSSLDIFPSLFNCSRAKDEEILSLVTLNCTLVI